MDVPLGSDRRAWNEQANPFKDILDFAPGTIIELNKIAGEPIDVTGKRQKLVAKGEVVVIEESFGIQNY